MNVLRNVHILAVLFLVVKKEVGEVGESVVAREYGIPAVIGVTQATARLRTRQRISVDGSSGLVVILDDETTGLSRVALLHPASWL